MPALASRALPRGMVLSTASANDEDGNSTSAIVAGSVVGGVLGLLVVGILGWWLVRRRRSARARREGGEDTNGSSARGDGAGGGADGKHADGSPERKFTRLDQSPSLTSGSLSAKSSPHLPLHTLPVLASADGRTPAPSAAPSGVGPHTVNGRPVSNAGVVGNANSGAYSPHNTRRPSAS